jgi:hypothetical protein
VHELLASAENVFGVGNGLIDRRSGIDSRSESERKAVGERRSGIERRSRLPTIGEMPSNEQLAVFARRLKRAMRDEKGRSFFGVASGEDHFTFFSEVIRVIEWIEHTVGSETDAKISCGWTAFYLQPRWLGSGD